MKILHLSYSDYAGGAAKAAYRIHKSIIDAGCRSRMVVADKQTEDENVIRVGKRRQTALRRLIKLGRSASQGSTLMREMFNYNYKTVYDKSVIYGSGSDPTDIVHMHWITNYLNDRDVYRIYERYGRPIVWTLMDQEPLTGGCHYSYECDGYKNICGACPQLKSNAIYDISRRTWNSKKNNLSKLPITFVAGTEWLADKVKYSSLFNQNRVEIIQVPINESIFREFDKGTARDLMHLPKRGRVLLFGASSFDDQRKGMRYLHDALSLLAKKIEYAEAGISYKDITLFAVGRGADQFMESLPFKKVSRGYLKDDITLALAYQASDIFVCPSIVDAGPMMIPESMMCGTPVVAFNSGGAPDLIDTKRNGYLAKYRCSKDLAQGILCMLNHPDYEEVRFAARAKAVNHHSGSIVAEKYVDLYKDLLN